MWRYVAGGTGLCFLLLLQTKNLVRSKVRNAFYCRLFNGRLRFCNPGIVIGPAAPNIPRETVFDASTGFIKFLYMQGFEFSCQNQVSSSGLVSAGVH